MQEGVGILSLFLSVCFMLVKSHPTLFCDNNNNNNYSYYYFYSFFTIHHSKRNEQYFGTGVALVELWDHAQSKLRGTTVPRAQRRQWQQQLDQLQSEAQALRTCLVAVRAWVCNVFVYCGVVLLVVFV